MKKIFIIGNWKCNPTKFVEAKKLFLFLKNKIKKKRKIKIIICPPFVYIFPLSKLNKGSKIILGAQDVFFEEKGPFTGQISPKMLKDLGCRYVIVGHSEKRKLGESDIEVNKKIKAVLKEGLVPIFCVGESLKEKKENKSFEKIKYQIKEGLKGIGKRNLEKILIAYEPIWAIGTDKPCKPDDVLTVSIFIKKIVGNFFGFKKQDLIKVLYGGSVSSENAKEYIEEAKVDGLLIGGNSLKGEEFLKIISSLFHV